MKKWEGGGDRRFLFWPVLPSSKSENKKQEKKIEIEENWPIPNLVPFLKTIADAFARQFSEKICKK